METQFVVMVLRLLFIWGVYISWRRFRKRRVGKREMQKPPPEQNMRRYPKRYTVQAAAVVLIAVVLFTPASAQIVEYVLHGDPSEEEIWLPSPLPTVKSVRDVFPKEFSLDQVEGSVMLSLADGIYASQQTGAAALAIECDEILLLLERHRSVGEPFELPDQLELYEAEKRCEYRTADTLAEYDGQIAWFVDEIQTGPEDQRGKNYYRVGITALNALQLCKEMGVADPETYWYYAELAFWGLANQYVFTKTDRQARVDLFYRVGQAYDYLGMIAKELPDGFRYRMYFLSAAFLRLAYDELESTGFARGDVLYWDDSWQLYLTMLYRLGLYMDAQTEYFRMLTEHAGVILSLELKAEEERKLLDLLTEVQKWPI